MEHKTKENMFCGNCGKQLEKGLKFCVGCGVKISKDPIANANCAFDCESVPNNNKTVALSRTSKIRIVSIVVAVVAVALVTVFVALMLFLPGNSEGRENSYGDNSSPLNTVTVDMITVPDFVGLKYDDIINDSEYSAYNITLKNEYSASVPRGEVISQSIGAGKKIKRNETIVLVVSNGSGMVQIPKIDGLNIKDAEMQLVKVGLEYNEIYTPSETVAKDCVITTNPVSGYVLQSETIDVYVSIGPDVKYSTVGNYVDLTESAAIQLIKKHGFKVGEITYRNSALKRGTVLMQSVGVGVILEKNTTIDIVVSLGDENVKYGSVVARNEETKEGGITNKRVGAPEQPDDTGAIIVIISKNIDKSVDKTDIITLNYGEKKSDGYYYTVGDGYYVAKNNYNGNYVLENVPEGEYVGLIISSYDYTKWKNYNNSSIASCLKSSDLGQYLNSNEIDILALAEAIQNREFHIGEFEVKDNETTAFYHGFGID